MYDGYHPSLVLLCYLMRDIFCSVACVWLSVAEIYWTTDKIYWTRDMLDVCIIDDILL